MICLAEMKIMKKIFLTFLCFLVILILSGCYYDYSKRNMELIDIKVYDLEGNEIEGEYKNYFNILTKINKEKLNSAAPAINYYVVDADEGDSFEVEFIFYSQRNRKMKYLRLESNNNDIIEITDLQDEDDKIIARVTFESINLDYQYFTVKEWKNKRNRSFYFYTKGSNSYIKGVYFNLDVDLEINLLM